MKIIYPHTMTNYQGRPAAMVATKPPVTPELIKFLKPFLPGDDLFAIPAVKDGKLLFCPPGGLPQGEDNVKIFDKALTQAQQAMEEFKKKSSE